MREADTSALSIVLLLRSRFTSEVSAQFTIEEACSDSGQIRATTDSFRVIRISSPLLILRNNVE